MFLRDVLDGGRPVLLFMHMPPFVMSPDDPASSSCVPPEPRRALLELCRTSGVRAIACGHLHIYRHMCWSDIDIVWAPGTSFVTTERWHQRLGTFPRAGYVAWTIDGQTLSHRVIEPPRMITMDLGLWSDTHGTTTKLPPLHGRVGT
jgi:hypothetical protein